MQWKIHRSPECLVRTRQHNIVIHCPGIKGNAMNAKVLLTAGDCFFFFYDNVMNTVPYLGSLICTLTSVGLNILEKRQPSLLL